MSQHREHQHSTRRIVLPSGKTIEVIRVDGGSALSAGPGLHVCPACDSRLVQPVEWGSVERQCWELTLHCPNCDWRTRGIYGHGQVAELEERLDDGVAEILRDLKQLTDANMADEVDRFVEALEADLILPEDF